MANTIAFVRQTLRMVDLLILLWQSLPCAGIDFEQAQPGRQGDLSANRRKP
jgi:hypothetical protein